MEIKKTEENLTIIFRYVRVERLELSHLAALDPKSSASTNSATPAFKGWQRYYFLTFTHKRSFKDFLVLFLFNFVTLI